MLSYSQSSYTNTCVAPVDASRGFDFDFSPNERFEGWRGDALLDFFLLFSFPRPVPRQLAHSQHPGFTWYLLAGFLPISAAASIYLCKPPYVIVGPVPSLSCHTVVCLLRSLPRVRRHRASSPHGSSSNGCCLFGGHHRLINVRVSFPTPTIGMKCIINRGPPHSLFSMLYAAHILGSAMVCMYVCKVITYI